MILQNINVLEEGFLQKDRNYEDSQLDNWTEAAQV